MNEQASLNVPPARDRVPCILQGGARRSECAVPQPNGDSPIAAESVTDTRVGDLPIVCTLRPGELTARATQFLPGVVAAATARYAIEGGFRFSRILPSLTVVPLKLKDILHKAGDPIRDVY